MIFERLKQQMMTVLVLKHFDLIREAILKTNFLCHDSSLARLSLLVLSDLFSLRHLD